MQGLHRLKKQNSEFSRLILFHLKTQTKKLYFIQNLIPLELRNINQRRIT
ncbi:unnamed protein product [Paramecium sonneborni]|uniref:Uncharacterized protein n=1 Tax=Paramecium sonneborni TaxID=65129 RepID=A0A8S1QSX7_9CILI|nr:unnamed protein product [Paramecium sonneborni]